MNVNNGVMIGTDTIPIEGIQNITIDWYTISIVVAVLFIIYFISKEAFRVIKIKSGYDRYIDSRIDDKIMPIQQKVKSLETQQALTKDDVQEIKIQMTTMNETLKNISDNMERVFALVIEHIKK